MVMTGRPRAHSASSVKLSQVLGSQGASPHHLSYSSPELRSMLVGLETTVPQNLSRPSHLGSRHKPHKRRHRSMGSRSSLAAVSLHAVTPSTAAVDVNDGDADRERGCCQSGCCSCCCRRVAGGRRCCHVTIFLVLMQLLVGAGVTAVSVYLYLFLPVFPLRETPFWAGAPLCLAGIFGVYFIAIDFKDFSASMHAFVLKVLCSLLSIVSVFVGVIAAIFAAIHLSRIFSFTSCSQYSRTQCHCYLERDDHLSRVFVYRGVTDCFMVFCEVKVYLLALGSLCLAGSVCSLSLLVLLWKARYGHFYSGSPQP